MSFKKKKMCEEEYKGDVTADTNINLVENFESSGGTLQWRAIETRHLLRRKDVSFILTIFPKNFWNK